MSHMSDVVATLPMDLLTADLPYGIAPPAVHASKPGFGLLLVGDELLSGRRQDQHAPKVIELLRQRGLDLEWIHMLGDDRDRITWELRQAFASGKVVFCCGGIGATPDDHTRHCAAAALKTPLQIHPTAKALLLERMQDMARQRNQPFNPEAPDTVQRLQMAVFPRGAQIIPNPFNKIAGFSVRHVHFFPGFPVMAWPMMEWVLDSYYRMWQGQQVRHEFSVIVRHAYEATLTPLMERTEASFAGVRVFSLPSVSHPEYGAHIELGVKGTGPNAERAFEALLDELKRLKYVLGPQKKS